MFEMIAYSFANKTVRATILFAVIGFIAFGAFAAQDYKAKDGDIISITLSARDMSRLKLKGDAKLARLKAPAGMLAYSVDESSGDVYLRPTAQAKPGFSFFAIDDLGGVYTLIVTKIQDIPAETILVTVQSEKVADKSTPKSGTKNTPHREAIKRLVKAMATNANADGFVKRPENQIVNLWKEALITLQATYIGRSFEGQTYLLRNISGEPMKLSETEFLNFGSAVRGVSIEHKTLQPNQETLIYVVRKANYKRGD